MRAKRLDGHTSKMKSAEKTTLATVYAVVKPGLPGERTQASRDAERGAVVASSRRGKAWEARRVRRREASSGAPHPSRGVYEISISVLSTISELATPMKRSPR